MIDEELNRENLMKKSPFNAKRGFDTIRMPVL